VYAALAAVMADVDHVAKRDQNKTQGFNFRGIDAVVNAVGPALRKHKVIVVPEVERYEYGTLTTSNGRAMGHARLVVSFTFYGPDGSSIRSSAAGEAFDSGDKATPKAHSVAFRTALLQALALPTDDPDPDQFAYERGAPGAPPAPPPPDPVTLAKNRVWAMTEGRGDSAERKNWIAAALQARGLTFDTATADDLNRMADEWAQVIAESAAAPAAEPTTEETP